MSARGVSLALIGVLLVGTQAVGMAAPAKNENPSAASILLIPRGRIHRAVLALDKLTRDLMRKTGVPGVAVAVVHDDNIVYAKGKIQRDWFAAYAPLFKALMANHSKLAGKTPPAHPSPSRSAGVYIGTYKNAYYGSATIGLKNGHLSMTLGPHATAFALSHWNGNTFSYHPVGENATGISAVTFTALSTQAHARTLTIENLNENAMGSFFR